MPRVYSFTPEQLEALARQIARSSTAAALGVKGGLSKAPEAPPNRSYGQEIPVPAAMQPPVVVDPGSIVDRAGSAGSLYLLKRSLEGQPASDPRDGQIRQLEDRLREVEFDKKMSSMRDEILNAVSSRLAELTPHLAHQKENGGGDDKILRLLLENSLALQNKIFERSMQPPPDSLEVLTKGVDAIQKFGSFQKGMGEFDLEGKKLDATVQMWQQRRADQLALEQARLQHEAAQIQANQNQFHDMMELGANALRDAVAPVTGALGEAVRARVAGGAPPAGGATSGNPPAMPRPEDVHPENRAEIAARLEASSRRATEFAVRLRELDRAASTPAPRPVATVPREDVPYGDVVEREEESP